MFVGWTDRLDADPNNEDENLSSKNMAVDIPFIAWHGCVSADVWCKCCLWMAWRSRFSLISERFSFGRLLELVGENIFSQPTNKDIRDKL